jgi:predicted SAM-dependent methyltransferase
MKLELGGGQSPRDGYDNMDARLGKDAMDKWDYKDESVDEIYSCEFIEHITEYGLRNVLSESMRVLVKGGTFKFGCPDYKGIMKIYTSSSKEEQDYMKRGLLGDGMHEFDYHRNIIWFDYMKKLMDEYGFININRIPSERTEHLNYDKEFIEKVKLWMIASKPM